MAAAETFDQDADGLVLVGNGGRDRAVDEAVQKTAAGEPPGALSLVETS
jgi:hypothetical protein